MTGRVIHALAIAGIIVLSVSTVRAAPSYTLTDLGAMDADRSSANRINNNGLISGTVVYENYENPFMGSESRPFLYENGSMTLFGSADFEINISDINDQGHLVGRVVGPGVPETGFLYKNGSMTYLPLDSASGINESEQIVVYEYLYENGTVTNLGTLGGAKTRAKAINESGQIAGYGWDSENRRLAFLYENGSMTALPTPEGLQSLCYDINDHGQIVGKRSNPSGPTDIRGVLWDDGVMYDLTDMAGLGGDTVLMRPRAINNSGQIVGRAVGTEFAFLYEDGNAYNLDDLVVSGPSHSLYEAFDINDLGQIVGWGYLDGNTRAFLLTPVLPGDVDGDSWVSGTDLSIILTHWGQSGLGREHGDLNGNGTVDGPDYSEVISNWGTGSPPEPSGIPEPTTLVVLSIGGLIFFGRRP